MSHSLSNVPALVYEAFSQRSPSSSACMVAECEANRFSDIICLLFNQQHPLCCIPKRTSSACVLCVAWFVMVVCSMADGHFSDVEKWESCVLVNTVFMFLLCQRYIIDGDILLNKEDSLPR